MILCILHRPQRPQRVGLTFEKQRKVHGTYLNISLTFTPPRAHRPTHTPSHLADQTKPIPGLDPDILKTYNQAAEEAYAPNRYE